MRGARGQLLARLRRASAVVRRGTLIALLTLAYAVVVPSLWLWLAVGRRRGAGWRVRGDRDVGTLERLRRPF